MGGVVLAAAAAVSSPNIASAQPAKPVPSSSSGASAADTAEAKLRFDEGIKLVEVGDHEAARLKFNQAWALLKSPGILFNLARAEHLSSRFVDSYEHYRQFVKLPPDPKITDTQRQRAGESILEISKKLALFEIAAPPNAKVTVDGRVVDIADPVVLLPGKYKFESTVDGRSIKAVTLEARAASFQRLNLTEDPTHFPAIAPPPPDDGAAPIATNKAGVRNNTGVGTSEPPAETRSSFWSGGRIAGAAITVVGLGGVVAGIVFHIGANKSGDDATDARNALPDPKDSACPSTPNPVTQPTCDKLKSSVDSQHSKDGLSTGFLVGGGALALAGVVVFIVAGPKVVSAEPSHGSLRVIPVVSGRDQRMVLTGSF